MKGKLNKHCIETTPDFLSGNSTNLRPYVNIEIGVTKMHSLVDTGSSRTYLGSVGSQILVSGGYKIEYSKVGAIMLVDGTIEAVIREACLPATFSETTYSIHFKIIPGLTDV